MLRNRMWVLVIVTAAVSAAAWCQAAVVAEPAAPASGTFAGVITEKGDTWIRLKAAGGESERFDVKWAGDASGGPDKTMVRRLAERKVGDKVEVKWTADERKRIADLKVLEIAAGEAPKAPKSEPARTAAPAKQEPPAPPGFEAGKSGTFAGAVTEKGEGWLRVKAADGQSVRFTAQWVGGGPDKNMVRAIAERRVGDKVELKWTADERPRVTELKLIEAAPPETPKAPAKTEPAKPPVKSDAAKSEAAKAAAAMEGQRGTYAGVVSEKGDTWLRVKTADGGSERFDVRYVEGGPEKAIVQAIAGVKVGQSVQISWLFLERKRVVELKVVGDAQK